VTAEVHKGFWWGNLREPLGKPRQGWEDIVTMNLQEVGWVGGGQVLD